MKDWKGCEWWWMKDYKEIDLESHFALAEKGKSLWERIDAKYNSDLYILFPHENEEYNYYALLHLDQYIEQKGAKKVVFLCSDSGMIKAIPLFTEKRIIIHRMLLDEIKAVIKYYALFEFTARLTIISLTEPYDTCGENFLGVKGITKEALLCYDIYQFNDVPIKERPGYNGRDKEIMRFLKLSGEK